MHERLQSYPGLQASLKASVARAKEIEAKEEQITAKKQTCQQRVATLQEEIDQEGPKPTH